MELHFKASLLLLSVFPLLSLGQLPSSASKSYLSDDSYSLYPPWLVDEGRLEFSFKTSHRNALLLYFESNAEFSGEFFKLSLVNGVLTAEIISTTSFLPVQVSIANQHLNDNQVHTVAVHHDRPSLRFTIQLDQSAPERTINYQAFFPGGLNHIAESGLYFGGVPENFTAHVGSSAPSDPHFIGCIINVRYSNDSTQPANSTNNSTQPADLFEAFPQEEVSVTAGCVDDIDPCEEVECGDGVCVPSFSVGICDCRGTNKLGANCTEGMHSIDMYNYRFNLHICTH